MVLINILMLLLYFVFKGGCPSFSCKRSPPLYLFYPTNIFVKQKVSYFCIICFLVVNLIVSFSLTERLHSFVHLLLVHA